MARLSLPALALVTACSTPAETRGEGAICDALLACDAPLVCVDGQCVWRPDAYVPPREELPPRVVLDIVDVDTPDVDGASPDEDVPAGDDADEVGAELRLLLAPHDALLDPSDTRLGLAGGQAAVREVIVPGAAEVIGVEAVVRAPEGTSGACALYDVALWVDDALTGMPVTPTFRSTAFYVSASAEPVRLDLAERVAVPAGRLRFGLVYGGPCEASFPPWLALDASGDTSDTFVWANVWIPGDTLSLDGRWGLSLAVALQFVDTSQAGPNNLAVVRSLVLMLVLLAACTGSEGDLSVAPSAPPERFAVVTLSWSSARVPDARTPEPKVDVALQPGAFAQAYFVEHAPGERTALLDFLNVPAATIAFDAAVAVDTCIVSHPETPSPAVLLDAGELTAESEDGETLLDSSYIPDGYLKVSGLVYEGQVAGQTTVVLAADGSDEVGPFSVTLSAPPPVHLLEVGGRAVQRGRVELGDLHDGLAVAWDEPTSPYDSVLDGDVAVVSYERRAFGDAWSVACAVRDDGHFVIPAQALGALPDFGNDATDRVVVRRLAGASFAAPGIPDGLALAIAEDAAYVE